MEINPDFSEKAKSDVSLVILATEGDQRAYTMLMKQYKESVFYLSLKIVKNKDDAMDITSSTFAKAFEDLGKYNGKFAFSTWLFRIATNNSIDFLRRRKMAMISLDESAHFGPGQSREPKEDSLNPEESSIKRQEHGQLREVVNKLPKEYRNVVNMRYFEELSYEEIAEQLDTPVGTIKARLYRAKDMMINALKNKNNISGL